MIKVQNLCKTYGDNIALNDVSINIKKGSIYGLIGQNGAGKTSLIRILNQIIEADSGAILFDGASITPQQVVQVGYLPEERGLYKNMTIEEQSLYFAQLKGMTKAKATEQLNYWLHRFDIFDWKKKKIQSLSKGMAQKVQFIITVIHQPRLLILDEPFSGFDPINASLIANEIKTLAKTGTTVVFSSHRMESVAEMCDAICLIHNGTILLQGDIKEIQNNYAQEIFEVKLQDYNDQLLQQFLDNTSYITSVKHQNKKEIDLEIIAIQSSKNGLLQQVLLIGQVVLYKQHLPSLQDIFIKVIENV